MRYDLGRFRRPMRRSTEGQLASLVGLGDGSTLSLDFTAMSGLDSRLTFSRSSTATVINSSGLVKYADHNLYYNTGFSNLSGGNPSLTSSGWQYALSTGGTATFNGDGSVTVAATSTRRAISRSAGFAAGSRRVIVSVDITTSGDTGLTPSQLVREGTFSNESYYINSTVWTSGNVVGPCTLSFVYDSGTGNANPYFGVGTASSSTGTVTFANPRVGFFNGVVPAPYLANTSTSAERNDARFDHDPTTLAPRGLLIEGASTNLCLNGSMAYTATAPTSWGRTFSGCTVASVDSTTFPGQKAWSISATASGQRDILTQTISFAANTTYTVSIYLEAVTGTTELFSYVESLPAGATSNNVSNPTTAGRVSYTVTIGATAGNGTLRIGLGASSGTGVSANASVRFSHVQVEAGSGPSSYIPTGASTVQRAADVCTMTGANFTSWYGAPTGWTLVTETIPQSRAPATFPGMVALRSNADSGLRIYYYNDGTYNTAFRFATASSGSEVFGPNSVTYGLPRKFGASVTSGTQIASSAGVQIGATQTLAVPMDQTVLGIGNDGATTPTVNCRMHVRNIKYWPYAMTLAQLNGVTA